MSSHKWGIYETPVDHHEFVDVFFKSAFVLYDFAVIAFERPNVCVCCTVSRKILRLRNLFSARFTLKSFIVADGGYPMLEGCLVLYEPTENHPYLTEEEKAFNFR